MASVQAEPPPHSQEQARVDQGNHETPTDVLPGASTLPETQLDQQDPSPECPSNASHDILSAGWLFYLDARGGLDSFTGVSLTSKERSLDEKIVAAIRKAMESPEFNADSTKAKEYASLCIENSALYVVPWILCSSIEVGHDKC